MRVAKFVEAGELLSVGEAPVPSTRVNDLILKVKACGICGSDLHMSDVHNHEGAMTPLSKGTVMGHEFCGEVVDIGPAVNQNFKIGDRVTALPFIGCGACVYCLSGSGHRCSEVVYTGLGAESGGYAEFVRASPIETIKLPEGVDWKTGALVEPLAVGLHSVKMAKLVAGDRVLILGAGPVGLAVALWCRYFGANHVIVSDFVPERLSVAESLGATAVINGLKEDVVGSFKKEVGSRPNVILECVGVPGTQQMAMNFAPAGGRIVVVGVCMAPDTILPVKAITKELQVNYVFMYQRSDFELTIDLLNRGLIDPSPLISDSVGFDDFSKTFDKLKTDKTACKVLLQP